MKNPIKLISILIALILFSCISNSKKRNNVADTKRVFHQVGQQANLKDTLLILKDFTVKLHNFDVHGGADGNGKIYYNGDSDEGRSNLDDKKNYWSLNITTDTAHLQIYGWDHDNIMELIPKDKNSKFKVSYHNNICIAGFDSTKGINIKIKSPYEFLKETTIRYFKIPAHIYDSYGDTARFKKILNLKDTSIRYKATDGKFYIKQLIIYKGQPCEIFSANPIYLKIERYNGFKLIETKYLTIEAVDSEVAD